MALAVGCLQCDRSLSRHRWGVRRGRKRKQAYRRTGIQPVSCWPSCLKKRYEAGPQLCSLCSTRCSHISHIIHRQLKPARQPTMYSRYAVRAMRKRYDEQRKKYYRNQALCHHSWERLSTSERCFVCPSFACEAKCSCGARICRDCLVCFQCRYCPRTDARC